MAAPPDANEVDVRFTYSAFMCFAVLRTLRDESAAPFLAQRERVEESMRLGVRFVLGCWRESEGAFAATPTTVSECHGGMTFCAVASIAIAKAFFEVNVATSLVSRLRRYVVCRVARGPEETGSSMTPRDQSAVGFQGRPCKPCDSCYAHWLGATLALVRRCDDVTGDGEVDDAGVARFCLSCLDEDARCGGVGVIGRSPDTEPDVVHAALGLSGALLALASSEPSEEHGLWTVMSPPHAVFGCSTATAALLHLPDVRSLML